MAKPEKKKRSFWRTCRICFRSFRITVLAVILALLCCLLYFNQIGLPDFIKKPVLERLHARGIDLEFTRMRWRWNQGIVAENVRFVRSDGSVSPRFLANSVEVELDYRALAKLNLQVNALVLHEAEFAWELTGTNTPDQRLAIENIHTRLRLLPGDLWELNEFRANFAGAQIQLGGVLTNASAIREWKTLQREPSQAGNLEKRLRQLAETLDQIHFATPPDLHLDVSGDILDLQSFTVRLNVNTPDAETPWGTLQEAFLTLVLLPGSSNVLSQAELYLEAARAQTPWAGVSSLKLQLNLLSTEADTNIIDANLNLSADNIETRWGRAGSVQWTAQWNQALTNAIPAAGQATLQLAGAETRFGAVERLRFSSSFARPSGELPVTNSGWAWWAQFAPYTATWKAELHGLSSPQLAIDEFLCAGHWTAPSLTMDHVSGRLYGGRATAGAGVDVASRRLIFNATSDFDIHRIMPLLTEKAREWIRQLRWETSPKLKVAGSLQLPAWTNLAQADWRGEVRPTLRLDGDFDVNRGSFRGVEFNAATSHFGYSNFVWNLPDLVARRTEGELRLSLDSNEATRDYHFQIHSAIHPLALKPLFPTNQHRVYNILGFNQPPVVAGDIRGRWYSPETIGARVHIAATNFTVHGELFDDAVGILEYTNLVIRVIEPRAHRGTDHGSATSLDIDIAARKIYLTNAVGTADPGVVTRAVGPNIGKLMEPYRFVKPVSARVHGIIPMRYVRDADMVFELEGGPFEWWKFRLPAVAGRVHWRGEHLELQGMQAQFYGGTATGEASFDFKQSDGTHFRFDVLANDADLGPLMADLSETTNRLEGRLTGRLTVTDAVSTNLNSVFGSGRVHLRDGLIWDIPLFGILSPVLDGLAPGMGSSRAREATATFAITNGVARSEDLEIRASMMRLQYLGTVRLEDHALDAKAQAELLRDTWIVGRLLSATLWPVSKIFEYRITGTLAKPKSDPVFFVPKILLLPFHPIRGLKELVPELPGSSSSNAVPVMP